MTTASCAVCGESFNKRQRNHQFCSTRCRMQSHRGDKAEKPTPASRLVETLEKELADAGILDTRLGQQAVDLATRMVHGSAKDTGSAYAALSRELSRAVEDAKSAAVHRTDLVDELTAKRQARISAA